MKLLVLLLLLLVVPARAAEDESDPKFWQHPEPVTYESLRAWHRNGGLQAYSWPKEHRLALTDDKAQEQVFLGLAGFGRGMTYALFTPKRAGGWQMLSDAIDGSDHPFDVLPVKHGRWHDFAATLPSGRGGIFRVIYTWNGKHYVQKSFREIKDGGASPEEIRRRLNSEKRSGPEPTP